VRPGALTAPRPAARAGTRSVGGGSFDAIAGSINPMFRFFAPRLKPVILNPTTGAAVRQ
jgi:hypothetical protein